MRCAISNVLDKTPSLSSRSSQLRQWGEELLDKSTHGEASLAAFDRFSETLIHYMRERISHVTKNLKLNSSYTHRICSDFHQIRLNPSGPMHSSWKELLEKLGITGTEADPLLEQSVYDEICMMLVLDYFTSQTAHNTDPTRTASTLVELTSNELNAMR